MVQFWISIYHNEKQNKLNEGLHPFRKHCFHSPKVKEKQIKTVVVIPLFQHTGSILVHVPSLGKVIRNKETCANIRQESDQFMNKINTINMKNHL